MNHKENFWEHGYLHVPEVFSEDEVLELTKDLEWLMEDWAENSPGWSGPWRKELMDPETERKSTLTAMHDLQFYSKCWFEAVTNQKIVSIVSDLIGPEVELHHSTMHVKPPSTGHPFPMHQDWAFYMHKDSRYVDVLIHLDDTCHENGEIRFLNGSHKNGPLQHIVKNEDGTPCTPHLSQKIFNLKESVPVPAKKGDIVLFNINTIHGSYTNKTSLPRKLVRVGYKNPNNIQLEGQSNQRPGLILSGTRKRNNGQSLFSTNSPRPIQTEDTFAVK